MALPLREQGTLLTVIRGCDLVPKLPLDSTARQLTSWLRYCILVPADPREVGMPGAFMQHQCPDFRPSELGHYPLHWVAHVMHAAEVIAYRCPEQAKSKQANIIYSAFVDSLHLWPESSAHMIRRLSEDRIANGTVVS